MAHSTGPSQEVSTLKYCSGSGRLFEQPRQSNAMMEIYETHNDTYAMPPGEETSAKTVEKGIQLDGIAATCTARDKPPLDVRHRIWPHIA